MPIEDIYQRAREYAKVESSIVERGSDEEDYSDLDSEEGRCIEEALAKYSMDSPWITNLKVVVPTGKSSVQLPEDWTDDYSVLDIYFEGSDDEDWIPMEKLDWALMRDYSQDPPRWRLKFNEFVNSEITVVYTRPHVIDPFASFQSIPKRDEIAISRLAAAFILRRAQSFYARKSENKTFQADMVNYSQLASRARQSASDAESFYANHIKTSNAARQGSSHIVAWELPSLVDGKRWMFRGR